MLMVVLVFIISIVYWEIRQRSKVGKRIKLPSWSRKENYIQCVYNLFFVHSIAYFFSSGEVPLCEPISKSGSPSSYDIWAQDLGMRRNIETALGPNPLFWCWPRPPLGNGLRYELSKQDGEWYNPNAVWKWRQPPLIVNLSLHAVSS